MMRVDQRHRYPGIDVVLLTVVLGAISKERVEQVTGGQIPRPIPARDWFPIERLLDAYAVDRAVAVVRGLDRIQEISFFKAVIDLRIFDAKSLRGWLQPMVRQRRRQYVVRKKCLVTQQHKVIVILNRGVPMA